MKAKKASINIREVARVARVGVATVSRVLNDSSLISAKTQEHVRAVIRQLGYRPNALARRIIRHSEMVCFALVNRPFLHSFHAGILQGAESRARMLKRHVVFLGINCPKEIPPSQIVLPPLLEEKGWVEGVILTGVVYPNLISRIEALGLQIVVFGNNVFTDGRRRELNKVWYDGVEGQIKAAEYLINHGHRSIAFVGDTEYPWFREQYEGYVKALRAHRLRPNAVIRKGPESFVEYGKWAANRLFDGKVVPTAILSGNDEIALGVSRSVRHLGLRIPADISLVGFDDREIAAVMESALTTVKVPSQEIGRQCMELLMEKLREGGSHVSSRLVPTQLIERDSVMWLGSERK
jgi:DNA-binding LacI/PurR family transcriptional regulator